MNENKENHLNVDVNKFVFANNWYYEKSDNSHENFINRIKELSRFCQLYGIVVKCTNNFIINEIHIDVGDIGMTNIRNTLESLEWFSGCTTTTDTYFIDATESVWKNEKFTPILATEIILPTKIEQMMKNKTTMTVRTHVGKCKENEGNQLK